MTTLYTKNGSYPAPLPERVRLPNGNTKTDSSTFTAEEILEWGYVETNPKPTISRFQRVDWIGTDWLVTDWSIEEKANYYRNIRDELLKETDIFGLADVTMSPEMTAYRQALRDVPQQEGFPDTIIWPELTEAI